MLLSTKFWYLAVVDITFTKGIICLVKCLPNLISEENIHVLIKLLLHFAEDHREQKKGMRMKYLSYTLVAASSCGSGIVYIWLFEIVSHQVHA